MPERICFSSGTTWEARVGYSRAVRVDRWVEVAGTTAIGEDGQIVGRGDAYAQAKFILAKIDKALQSVGSGLKEVVRTRIYLIDIADADPVGRAHGETFAEIRPASTMLAVQALVDPAMLVEIEVTAQILA